ncbi:MAG: type II secretion system protein, partial [Terriglobales bacterium]
MKSRAAQNGFSLITIALLLMVASVTLTLLLPATRSRPANDSNATVQLNKVLASLRAYQATNGYLPCPADASQPIGGTSYGVAAANGGASGNCTGGSPAANYTDSTNHVAIGMVPVRTLGLPNAAALDAYGRDITYAVDTNATACWASSSLTGQVVVTDNGSTYDTIAALVSHGYDGHGAWLPLTGSSGTAMRLNAASTDTDEHLVNAHGLGGGGFPADYSSIDSLVTSAESTTTTFVRKPPTSTFDNLVVYKSPLWTLNNLPKSIPAISAITPPANGTYTTGQVLTFTVTYSSAVTVTTTGGAPYLSLSAITGSIGTGNLAKATYQSGSGTTTLTFSYT